MQTTPFALSLCMFMISRFFCPGRTGNFTFYTDLHQQMTLACNTSPSLSFDRQDFAWISLWSFALYCWGLFVNDGYQALLVISHVTANGYPREPRILPCRYDTFNLSIPVRINRLEFGAEGNVCAGLGMSLRRRYHTSWTMECVESH
ncbi:hypothetical protein BDV26DRAFT_3783 [Aspergillus bertholletiae]|uniref:Uncharacterized protein n=1 Tax=Aspergillus bertholletiae TaxID=1226010 RepID=A0A5N7BKX0_9EURO|nr:hypothetical protein BDV26DRAFT_3783 [Aspergillus bertholletiae]